MRVAAIVPAYRVTGQVLGLLAAIGPECERIYVVDDACPDGSGALVGRENRDPRVRVVRLAQNQGVGGAVMAGYKAALADGMQVLVKLDGDGQMDPALLPAFVAPIAAGEADYTKGNRFYDLRAIGRMPALRRFDNLVLSFMAKAFTGYWDLFDPTNGYTALHAEVARRLPYESISRRYFFETDMLFRLNTLRAVVVDIPMGARYGDERSNLRVSRVLGEFAVKHLRNACKRVVYNYFLRDLSPASIELVVGGVLTLFALIHGSLAWMESLRSGVPASTGTVILPALTLLLGMQLLLAFVAFDVGDIPRRPLQSRFRRIGGAP